jgi:hypothetical protein
MSLIVLSSFIHNDIFFIDRIGKYMADNKFRPANF